MDLVFSIEALLHALAPTALSGYLTAAYIQAAQTTCPDCHCAPHFVCGGQGLDIVSSGHTTQCGWGFLPGFLAGASTVLLALLAF